MKWDQIPGWFDWEDGVEEAVHHFPSGTFVEVGNFLGRSLCCLAQTVQNSRKPIKVVGVEWGRGSGIENGDDNHAEALARGGGTLAGLLHRNLIECGVADTVTLMVTDSITAASFFPDHSLQLVFLDACHDYASVKADILAWKDKVAPGGWLCGDDYCPIWPGVAQAVNELLPGATNWSWDSWRYQLPEN